jgi:hypothetical protein
MLPVEFVYTSESFRGVNSALTLLRQIRRDTLDPHQKEEALVAATTVAQAAGEFIARSLLEGEINKESQKKLVGNLLTVGLRYRRYSPFSLTYRSPEETLQHIYPLLQNIDQGASLMVESWQHSSVFAPLSADLLLASAYSEYARETDGVRIPIHPVGIGDCSLKPIMCNFPNKSLFPNADHQAIIFLDEKILGHTQAVMEEKLIDVFPHVETFYATSLITSPIPTLPRS